MPRRFWPILSISLALAVVATLGAASVLLDTKVEEGLTVWDVPTLERACIDIATSRIFQPVWYSAYKVCAFRIPAFLEGVRNTPAILATSVVVLGAVFVLGWIALTVVFAPIILAGEAVKYIYGRFRRRSSKS